MNNYGDFLGDLVRRVAQVVSTDNFGEITAIVPHVPLAELIGYSSAMRSFSQGRAGSTMELYQYQPAPADVADSFAL